MDIERFMQGYKPAWEGRSKALFCRLFAKDGVYHNTPLAVQRGHDQLAASAGTHQLSRKPGDPLPRIALDGVLQARFEGDHCQECRLWWHSMPLAA